MANKKQKRLIFRTIVLLILLGAVVFALVTNLNNDNEVLEEGQLAKNFELAQIGANNTFNLHDDFKGKGVMLNFWATYCEPCKDEMPYMEQLYPKFKEKGVEILAVSLDSTTLVIENFMKKNNLTFPIVHDKRGEVMDAYNIVPIPTTYFIHPDGTIARIVEGPLTLSNLESYLNEIVPDS
ncbi:peroxiredoxin [Salirhabdus euzebyi]|uniref:Peroxiredoxin n=1 Tax=Salirhabdus euzebyi TaxID=394506 RepID=A0A841QAH1_9BACI|nr:thiol-disulfide oxidoreductase ResA [Salirhabdus euzebyi]MBB6455283.1 peroxiredoxin [Salirhabdus euzebyi]